MCYHSSRAGDIVPQVRAAGECGRTPEAIRQGGGNGEMQAAIVSAGPAPEARSGIKIVPRWQPPRGVAASAWLLARREMRDLAGDWRILGPAVLLTVIFPLLMVMITVQGGAFLLGRGSSIKIDSLVPL